MRKTLFAICMVLLCVLHGQEEKPKPGIDCVWLTHSEPTADSVTICWMSPEPGESRVKIALEGEPEKEIVVEGKRTLHHVKVPITLGTKHYQYQVFTGDKSSVPRRFKQYPDLRQPGAELRVIIIGNRGYWNVKERNWKAVYALNAHLGLSVGDNVPLLYDADHVGETAVHNLARYVRLIRSQMTWFATTPFMPVMGNHDHQIRDRAKVEKRPLTEDEKKNPIAVSAYDVEGRAFCEFFPLPDNRWTWHFDVPNTNLRFIGLDLNHDRDYGTTWGSCHAYHPESEQYKWFEKTIADAPEKFRFTLHNSAHSVGTLNNNALWKLFNQCMVNFSGNSYIAARDRMKIGNYCYTTSLRGLATAKFRQGETYYSEGIDNFTLLTITADKIRIELRKLEDGSVLDKVVELPLNDTKLPKEEKP